MIEAIIDAGRPFYFRGKGRLLNRIWPHLGTKTCEVFGFTFNLDLADEIQRNVYFGTFEPKETEIIRVHLRSGMTFVDVGANVGYFTALAASLVGPKGRVIAFEPSPYAFERLRRMIDINKLDHVRVVHAGLSDRAGRLKLYLGVGSRNHAPTMVPHDNATAVEVPVRTLDSVMEEMGVDHIDLIKIDVEGHEPRVLEGAQKLLRDRRVQAVLCEFNEYWLVQGGSSPERLQALIADGGLVEATQASSGRSLENRFFSLVQ
ncbi:MAG: FkbM family methyltransferase [Bryobacteraceae bacterium]